MLSSKCLNKAAPSTESHWEYISELIRILSYLCFIESFKDNAFLANCKEESVYSSLHKYLAFQYNALSFLSRFKDESLSEPASLSIFSIDIRMESNGAKSLNCHSSFKVRESNSPPAATHRCGDRRRCRSQPVKGIATAIRRSMPNINVRIMNVSLSVANLSKINRLRRIFHPSRVPVEGKKLHHIAKACNFATDFQP